MNKRWTAFLLSLVMLCAAAPATATNGSQDARDAAVSAERAASGREMEEQGVWMEETSEMAADGELIEPDILSQQEHEALIEDAEPTAEFTMSQNFSAEQGSADVENNYAEYQTASFTTYGAQLTNLVYSYGNKKIALGATLQKLYNNIKTDLANGSGSLVFMGETDEVKKLGVSFQLPGVSATDYDDIVRALGWRVYLCIDSDCPEMFYSNGFCSIGYSKSGSTISMYIIPGYRAGFTTLYQRMALKNQMDTTVNQLIAESRNYVTAYEKMEFFHDWLCENNTYNDEAANSSVGTYSADISGTPWSSVSALLSSTNSSVKSPVCEGYARAFQLLCQRAGITATVVSSTSGNHMWNNVKYGNTWTGVDITWDDGVGGYTHDYFCRAINGISGHGMDDQYFADWFSYPILSSITGKNVLPYYDIPEQYWGRDIVQYAYDNQYMVGVTCVQFGPEIRVSRSQFVRILYNIAGNPEVTYTAQFLDVPDGKWYTDAVMWAYENGVVAGYNNGYFGVDDDITREQMVKMLCDYCADVRSDEPSDDQTDQTDTQTDDPTDQTDATTDDQTDQTDIQTDDPTDQTDTPADDQTDPEPVSVLAAFTDAADVSSWAYDAMCWAVENDIIHGYLDGTLKPGGRAVRMEGAVLIQTMQQYRAALEEKADTEPDIDTQTP